jgi:hypothetical protein
MSSEEDTFDRLRRISYNDACVEYVVLLMEFSVPINLPFDEIALILDPHLATFGWTCADLLAVNTNSFMVP